jgi:hypothetical protein
LLAIAHHHLGHADEARRCLEKADHWAAEADRVETDATGIDDPLNRVWAGWFEKVENHALRSEAAVLLDAR